MEEGSYTLDDVMKELFYSAGGSGDQGWPPVDPDNPMGGILHTLGLDKGEEYVPFKGMNIPKRDILPDELSAQTRFVFTVLYIVIITLGFTGNVTTILVIALSREMRTVTNVFLVSLAISDGLIAALNMPVQLNNYLQNEWTLGVVMCKFTHYMQGVVVVASILTLTALAIDRYYAICHPLKARHLHTLSRAVLVVGIIWAVALLLLIPQIFIQRLEPLLVLEPPDNPTTLRQANVCNEYFSDPRLAVAYTLFFYNVLYSLPVLIMFCTYGLLAHKLWRRRPIGETTQSQRESNKRISEKKKIVLMLVVIVVLFTISWFPFFTCQIYLLVHGDHGHHSLYREIMAYLQLLGYSNCCVNPVVYCFLNDSFQKSFLALITGRICRKSSMVQTSTTGTSKFPLKTRRNRRSSSLTDGSLQHGTTMTMTNCGTMTGRRPSCSPEHYNTAV